MDLDKMINHVSKKTGVPEFPDTTGMEAARIERETADNQGEQKGDPNCSICHGSGLIYRANGTDDYDVESVCVCVPVEKL
jgi:hypothetical protein